MEDFAMDKPSLELFVLISFILNGNIVMDDEFALIWQDVIVNYFSLLENKSISLQTSVRITRNLHEIVYEEPGVSSTVIFSVKIEKADEVS
jgi:aromatic ring-opening dioxygenase LigB subunit